MSKRKLTTEEIDDLYKFCEDQGVRYYDLQIELVDHLGSSIENIWEQDSTVSFQDALDETNKSFKDKGFKTFQKEKKRTLQEKYSRTHRQYIKDFFRWPRVIKTTSYSLALFTAFRFSNKDDFMVLFLMCLLLFFILYQTLISSNRFKFRQVPQKSFLILRIGSYMRLSAIAVIFLPLNLGNLIRDDVKLSVLLRENNLYVELVFTIAFTLTALAVLVLSKYIPERINADFTREFPQFVKS